MKVLKTILIVFIVLFLVAGIGAYIFIKTLDVNKFKPQIVEQLQKALGRNVALGNISLKLSLMSGIAVELKDFSIAEDPAFGQNNFANVNAVYLNVDAMAYLKSKTVSVTKLSIEKPQITLIKNESGVFNYQSIVDHATGANQSSPTTTNTAQPATTNNSSSPAALPLILVKSIELNNGEVLYQDKMPATAMTVPLKDIDVRVKNFSLDKPFIVDAKLSLFSQVQNIQSTGQISIDMGKQSAQVSHLTVKSDLSQLSTEQMKQAIASLAPINFDGGMKGLVNVSVDTLNAGSAGLTSMKANVQLSQGEVKLKEIYSAFTQMTADVDITEADVMLKNFTTDFASGKITAQGRLDDYLKAQKPTFNIDINQLQVAQIVDPAMIQDKVEGKITAQLSGEAQGISPELLKSSLSGKGSFNLLEGRIIDINLLKTILDNLSAIPGVGAGLKEQVSNSLPEAYKERLQMKDTIIDQCQTSLQLLNGAAQFNDLIIQSNGVRVNMNGQMDLDQNVILDGQVALDEVLSSTIVANNNAFSYLMNENKEIAIPLTRYQGKLAGIRVFPNLKDFATNAVMNKGKEELKNVIFKALDIQGNNQEQPASQNPNGNQPTSNQQEPSSDQKAIESLIDQIPFFKKK
jgi:uncharacterized protein involved in outer membrane biogenesis